MFIAMNRFKVRKGSEHAFEQVWLTRETHLETVPGFVVFHLLKGSQHGLAIIRHRLVIGGFGCSQIGAIASSLEDRL